ncbi:MAG: LamG domain-containing protein [Acidobacteria bacterium]|nr:LamG domain-containing protein [Acidobacteriota bacterium]
MTRALLPLFLAVSTIAAVVAQQGALTGQAAGQGGDQFLDGIGETSLVARYQFNGNTEDSSRNQLHATMRGTGAVFVDDGGRRVLLLTGAGSHVQLPSDALEGEDAIAVVGWLYLPTRATGPVFDFGQNIDTRIFAVVDAQGFRASAVVGGKTQGEAPAKPVVENQWIHFAVVLDPATKVLTTYLDGVRAAQATGVAVTPDQLVPQALSTNRLFLGRTQDDSAATLHGRLRDVRLYRIALGDEPIATIRRNALAATQTAQRWPRRGRGAADLHRQHPEGISICREADCGSGHHCGNGRRHVAATAGVHPRHVCGAVLPVRRA